MGPGDMDFVLFMKVGMHGGETFDSIVARKLIEEAQAGFFMWGYGGAACHPQRQVAPFVNLALTQGAPLWLVMVPTDSRHTTVGRESELMSTDAKEWRRIPDGIHVTHSRHALVARNLQPFEKDLNFSDFAVAVGPSEGKLVIDYLRGRTDKVCARRVRSARSGCIPARSCLRAELTAPYAVFLR